MGEIPRSERNHSTYYKTESADSVPDVGKMPYRDALRLSSSILFSF